MNGDGEFADSSFVNSQVCYELDFLENPYSEEDVLSIDRQEQAYYSKKGKTFECSVCFAKFSKYTFLSQHKDSHLSSKRHTESQHQLNQEDSPRLDENSICLEEIESSLFSPRLGYYDDDDDDDDKNIQQLSETLLQGSEEEEQGRQIPKSPQHSIDY